MPAATRTLDLSGAAVLVFDDPADACREAADRIEATIREAVSLRGKAVLGLATGNTPIPIYERLVARHREGRLSFAEVSTYNLDEYYPMGPFDPQGYRAYMHRHLFAHVDLAPNRAHVPDGTVPEAFADEYGEAFDRWVAADGGLDLQLLGLGRNGHIGFNEPMDLPPERAAALPTRVVSLHPVTTADAARDFGGEDRVPARALTMGTATILAARSILVLAFGASKAEAAAASLTGPVSGAMPGSLLRSAAGRVTWLLDEAAAAGLPR